MTRRLTSQITHEDVRTLCTLLILGEETVSEQTFQDLELPQVCERLLPQSSPCGLFATLARLICPHPDTSSAILDHGGMSPRSARRLLRKLGQIDAALILRGSPDRMGRLTELILARVPWLQVALLAASPFCHPCLFAFLLLAMVNISAAFLLKWRMEASCYRELLRLNGTWRMLSRSGRGGRSESTSKGAAIGSRLVLQVDDLARLDPSGFLELIMAFLGLDVMNFLLCNRQLRDQREHVARMLDELGCFEHSHRSIIRQVLHEGDIRSRLGGIHVLDLEHPLIAGCQPLTMEGMARILLLHGDNMSGKSSLLRALGLDIVFRAGLGQGMSRSLALPADRVESIVNKLDDRAKGESLFYRELRRTHEALGRLCDSGGILLLDEPFSGTHRRIRHALLQAILEDPRYQLIQIVVATHDDELRIMGADTLFLHVSGDGQAIRREVTKRAVQTWDTERLMRRVGIPESVIARFTQLMPN